jgi:hypothetical protein
VAPPESGAGSRPDTAAPAGGSGPAAPAAAGGPPTGAGEAGPDRPAPLAVRAGWGVLVCVAALGLALVECFLVPLRAGTVPLPVSVPLAIAGNVVLARLAGELTGRPLLGALPPVLWLVVVLVLAVPRAEGDLVVPGTLTGLVFLFGGAVAGAYGAASTAIRRRNPTITA